MPALTIGFAGLLFFFSSICTAQIAKHIVGSWKFAEVADKAKLDSVTLSEANVLFGKMEMEFQPDGKLRFQSLTGDWRLSKDTSKVIISFTNPVNPDDKRVVEWGLKKASAKELRLDMGKAVIVFAPVQASPSTAKAPKPMEVDPFEVVRYVRIRSTAELLAYLAKCGTKYTPTPGQEKTEYKASGSIQYGVESFVDSKTEGIALTYRFKDSKQKAQYMDRLKEEGFIAKEQPIATAHLTKEGVDIWMIPGRKTWIISNSPQDPKDKQAMTILGLFSKNDSLLRPKMKGLLSHLEASMKMDNQGNFNRGSWAHYSSIIKKDYCASLYSIIKNYQSELTASGIKHGDDELADLISNSLLSAEAFVKTCENWADNIRFKDLDGSTIEKMLEVLEKNSGKMAKDDRAVLLLSASYKKKYRL